MENRTILGVAIFIFILWFQATLQFEQTTTVEADVQVQFTESAVNITSSNNSNKLLVIGASLKDMLSYSSTAIILGTSNPASITQKWGGVGRNVAEAAGTFLSPLYKHVGLLEGHQKQLKMLTVIGEDEVGKDFLSKHNSIFDTSSVLVNNKESNDLYRKNYFINQFYIKVMDIISHIDRNIQSRYYLEIINYYSSISTDKSGLIEFQFIKNMYNSIFAFCNEIEKAELENIIERIERKEEYEMSSTELERVGMSGVYLAIFDGTKSNDLVVSTSQDSGIHLITPYYIIQHFQVVFNSKLIVIDANLSVETINFLINICYYVRDKYAELHVWFEPTSIYKALKITSSSYSNFNARQYTTDLLSKLSYLSGNIDEIMEIYNSISNIPIPQDENNRKEWVVVASPVENLGSGHEEYKYIRESTWIDASSFENKHFQRSVKYLRHFIEIGVKHVIVTMSAHALIFAQYCDEVEYSFLNSGSDICYYFYEIPNVEKVANVNGAGDTFVGCTASAITSGIRLRTAVAYGIYCSQCVVTNNFSLSSVERFAGRLTDVA